MHESQQPWRTLVWDLLFFRWQLVYCSMNTQVHVCANIRHICTYPNFVSTTLLQSSSAVQTAGPAFRVLTAAAAETYIVNYAYGVTCGKSCGPASWPYDFYAHYVILYHQVNLGPPWPRPWDSLNGPVGRNL